MSLHPQHDFINFIHSITFLFGRTSSLCLPKTQITKRKKKKKSNTKIKNINTNGGKRPTVSRPSTPFVPENL